MAVRQAAAPSPGAIWSRPCLTMFRAEAAEQGTSAVNADGQFTTS